jgi:hypothetical protein
MPTDRVTILAGSKGFTEALSRPIAERLGEAPRLAADPGQAVALCLSGPAVLVLEYGPAWASVVEDLSRAASELRIFAALPAKASGAEPALRALGVRTVPWDGEPAPLLDAIGPAGPALPPAPAPAHTPAPGGFFRDVGADAAAAPAIPAQPRVPLWPSTAPGEEDAEHILCSALAGLAAAGDPALEATLEALTPLETEALQSLASVADPAPVRRLAALRYRVAFALSTAPAPGSPLDAGGGNLLLTEIDEALPSLKGVADRLPGRAAETEAIRNALVKQAVDLSEVLHRLQPGAPAAPAARAPDPRRTTGRMRIDAIPEPAARERRRVGIWVTLAVTIVATAAFHGWNRFLRPEPAPPPGPFGIPAGTTGAEAPGPAGRLVIPRSGQVPAPADVEAFRVGEEAAGRSVQEIAPGVFLSRPSNPSPGSPGGGP